MGDRALAVRNRTLAALILLGSPQLAIADDKADAKKHVTLAQKLQAQNKFAEALDELTEAYALDPQPALLYTIGQLETKLDRCVDALPFYERFLDTNPKPALAKAAHDAVDACKQKLAAEPKPPPPPEPKPVEPAPVPIQPAPQPGAKPFYTDVIGDALVGGGILGGIVSIVMYRSATSDLDSAEKARTYQASLDLIDQAHHARTYSVITGTAGVVLIGAGVVRFVLRGKSSETPVAIVPTSHGGFVTWNGRF